MSWKSVAQKHVEKDCFPQKSLEKVLGKSGAERHSRVPHKTNKNTAHERHGRMSSKSVLEKCEAYHKAFLQDCLRYSTLFFIQVRWFHSVSLTGRKPERSRGRLCAWLIVALSWCYCAVGALSATPHEGPPTASYQYNSIQYPIGRSCLFVRFGARHTPTRLDTCKLTLL